MSWAIQIPYRDREGLIVDVIDCAREILNGEELQVTEALAFGALERGTVRVGALLDELEQASPAERRALADQAREAAGLLSFSQIEENQEVARATRWPPPPPSSGPPRDGDGRALQQCPHCAEISRSVDGATIGPVREKRWHCEQHRHLAEPGDLEPWGEPMRFDPMTGGLRMSEAAEAHYARVYERAVAEAAEQRRIKQEQRKREAEALAKVRERHEANVRPINIGGFTVGAGGKIIDDR